MNDPISDKKASRVTESLPESSSEATSTRSSTDLIQKAMDAIAVLKTRIDSQVEEISAELPPSQVIQDSSNTALASIVSNRRRTRKKRTGHTLSFDQDLSSARGMGRYLKAWRQKRRLSQTEVAGAIDAAQAWYSMLEAGLIANPDRGRLANIARLYDQNPKRFYAGSAFTDVYRWSVSTKPRAGFCSNIDCSGLKSSRSRFFRKGLLVPMYFSQKIFKPRTTCHSCNSQLVVFCAQCQFPIQRRGERYCADCQAFHFVALAKAILDLNPGRSFSDQDVETNAVLVLELIQSKMIGKK
jgi:transcriptional regulator with XRE-family HTH domain